MAKLNITQEAPVEKKTLCFLSPSTCVDDDGVIWSCSAMPGTARIDCDYCGEYIPVGELFYSSEEECLCDNCVKLINMSDLWEAYNRSVSS